MNLFVETFFHHLVDHWEKQGEKNMERSDKTLRVLTSSGRELVWE